LDVSTDNPGYAIINSEIVKYTSVGTNKIVVDASGRGIDNTITSAHNSGDVITKYELNGISLRRINNPIHTVSSLGLEADSYHIEIDASSTNGKDRSSDTGSTPQISFNSDEFAGGDNVLSSENILFNAVIPTYDFITPVGGNESVFTDISASVRTTTGTSVSGNEASFVDNGYQNVALNRYNTLRSVRMVASKVNEDEYLTDLPRNKSFTTNLILTSNNSNLSPIIYLNGGSSTEFISNRLNQPLNGTVIDPAKNDGRPDSFVPPNVDGEYSEYVFSADNLDDFVGYTIKIMMSGTNQAYYPKITDLRTIALA